jgi:hypothetical protein
MSPFVIPIMALLIPLILGPVALGLRHARLERELEHRERMRALELGRTHPKDEPWWTPARICVMIGAGVPVGVFFCAWMATMASGFHEIIWAMAGMSAMTAVICGSLLAAKHFAHRAHAESYVSGYDAKPAFDADAFDVVGSRG